MYILGIITSEHRQTHTWWQIIKRLLAHACAKRTCVRITVIPYFHSKNIRTERYRSLQRSGQLVFSSLFSLLSVSLPKEKQFSKHRCSQGWTWPVLFYDEQHRGWLSVSGGQERNKQTGLKTKRPSCHKAFVFVCMYVCPFKVKRSPIVLIKTT